MGVDAYIKTRKIHVYLYTIFYTFYVNKYERLTNTNIFPIMSVKSGKVYCILYTIVKNS